MYIRHTLHTLLTPRSHTRRLTVKHRRIYITSGIDIYHISQRYTSHQVRVHTHHTRIHITPGGENIRPKYASHSGIDTDHTQQGYTLITSGRYTHDIRDTHHTREGYTLQQGGIHTASDTQHTRDTHHTRQHQALHRVTIRRQTESRPESRHKNPIAARQT